MEVDLHSLGIPAIVPLKNISIPIELIPRERITGEILEAGGARRCVLEYLKVVNQGTYGIIQKVRRGSDTLVVKRPTAAATKDSLLAEAVVQWIAGNVLAGQGVRGAVPEVADIFMHGSEARFAMEYIDGKSALETIYNSADPDRTFIECLSQVCLILSILEDKIFLDHRDLKMTNLWIRRRPVSYSYGGVHLDAAFQVVVLDFGFACLGNGEGATMVNLGDVIPDIDPCPKDGRDLYQCIMSLWSVEQVRSRLSASMQTEVKTWIAVKGGGARIADSSSSLEWAYMLTSHPKFSHGLLRPERLLKRLLSFS